MSISETVKKPNSQKDNQATSEETHGTEDVYCCACEYDIACFESKLRELLQSEKDRLKEEVEKMIEREVDYPEKDFQEYARKKSNMKLEEVLNLFK